MYAKGVFRLAAAITVTVFMGVLTMQSAIAAGSLGPFTDSGDVGSPKNAGSTEYDPKLDSFTVTGSGENMWAGKDQMQFVWKRIKGDFIVTARGKFLTEGGDQHKKFGWTARASLDTDAANVSTPLHGDGLADLLYRKTAGAKTEEKRFDVKGADVVQLERRGNTYIMSVAKFGEPFVSQEVSDIDLGEEPYVGLFVCAHNKDAIHKVQFDGVRITIPADPKFVPYKDYIGSNLEILDLETGRREIVYRVSDSLQAPNWTPDGKALIYNRNGRLYRFDLEKRGEPTLLDTGIATNNNNDHVISPDGQWIGISHHVKEEGNKSNVFVVPIDGGPARRITPQGNSYFHSWTPDGRAMIYTGERNKVFDIYQMWVEGGEEKRLTDGNGLNDGPEFSPDGKYIYFNSTRKGKMQLYRMKPDGSDIEQLTDDEWNNWFPHFSPDKKSIVFISFPADINPKDHPFYKHVYLRLMPYPDGESKVIAYLYGGQGTINVPSWSPDSKKLAFVSNTAGQ
jgi:TolB protein